ncbi:hypothetical protein HG15A2_48340 [Adhaeretor mobilis]|uniref:Uncharacterized protein n=1 Tax=Adhaeretor mobilis TaxID=1930276 RepID=A0A517N2Y0_9BACT|nr:hypothetical protein HG15A2_48340 [Adhaeretor mobilis]
MCLQAIGNVRLRHHHRRHPGTAHGLFRPKWRIKNNQPDERLVVFNVYREPGTQALACLFLR